MDLIPVDEKALSPIMIKLLGKVTFSKFSHPENESEFMVFIPIGTQKELMFLQL